MSDVLCERQISFTIGGSPGVIITATEDGTGKINFTVDVDNASGTTADLRALFFDVPGAKMAGLTVSGGDGHLTETQIRQDRVIDLGDGATLAGKTKALFDVGLEWGFAGGKNDNIDYAVSFTLSNAANNLTLDDIAFQRFGAKVDSIGGGSAKGTSSAKLLGTAPAAPDARDDAWEIYEDGAAGLDSPSKDPVGTIFNVLANDTDADVGSVLTVTHVDGAEHGTVTISADGKSVIYTPALDYSGMDSFEYCVSDGQGGIDSAVVTVEVVAVADKPVISVSVAPGATINDVVLHVSAQADDADGSESIGAISFINPLDMPGGVTVVADGPMTVVNGVTQQSYRVSTAVGVDYDFNTLFGATSVEATNGDMESVIVSKRIELDFTHNEGTATFEAVNQSMWGSGDAFYFAHDQFHGISVGDPDGHGFDFEIVEAGYTAFFELGLDVDFEINGGTINADLDVSVTVDSTWNKTTDQLFLSSSAILAGGNFVTQSPEAHLFLELIARGELSAYVDATGFPRLSAGGSFDFSKVLVDLDSDDLNTTIGLGAGSTLNLAWPNLSVTNDPGTLSGSGLSNPFATLNLDIDGLIAQAVPPIALLDPDPASETNFEFADLDLVGTLAMFQEFNMALGQRQVTLILEDGTPFDLVIGNDLLIDNASSHDLNNDGVLNFGFSFAPKIEVTNKTGIDADVRVDFVVLENASIDVPDWLPFTPDRINISPLIDTSYELFATRVAIFDETFELEGTGETTFSFFA